MILEFSYDIICSRFIDLHFLSKKRKSLKKRFFIRDFSDVTDYIMRDLTFDVIILLINVIKEI